jgi:hypothetical protein
LLVICTTESSTYFNLVLRGEEVEATEEELVFWEEELDSRCAAITVGWSINIPNGIIIIIATANIDCCENYRFSHSFDVRNWSYEGYRPLICFC